MIRMAFASLSLLCLALAAGCVAIAAAGAGVGTYAYVSGDLEKHLEAPLERVHGAALAAMAELEFRVTSDRKDALEAVIKAEQADDTSVRISLEAAGENLTEVRIRVGFFGDEGQSALILEKIEGGL